MLKTTQTQGTIATLRSLLDRFLHDQPGVKALPQGRDYRVSRGAVLVDVPRVHMVRVRTDQCLYLVSLVGVTVLAVVEW